MISIRKSTTCFLALMAALTFTSAVNAKEKPAEKAEGLEYQVSKSTLYNQLSYDLGRHGYSLKWDLRQDSNFTPHIYSSDRDQITDTLNVLNKKIDGSFEDGNYVQGLICKQRKQVVITYSRFAKGVVDNDGHSCLLISPVKSSSEQQSFGGYNLNATTQPTTDVNNQNIPGARIVGN